MTRKRILSLLLTLVLLLSCTGWTSALAAQQAASSPAIVQQAPACGVTPVSTAPGSTAVRYREPAAVSPPEYTHRLPEGTAFRARTLSVQGASSRIAYPSGITLNNSSMELNEGGSFRLTATDGQGNT